MIDGEAVQETSDPLMPCKAEATEGVAGPPGERRVVPGVGGNVDAGLVELEWRMGQAAVTA
jgi:hypothetical protein